MPARSPDLRQWPKVQRVAILALMATAIALLLSGGAGAAPRDGALDTPIGTSAAFTSSVRLPDVVVRTEPDRDDTRIGRSSHAGPLLLFVPMVVGLLAMLALARRPLARRGAPVWTRSPRRHSVPLRAPPAFRVS